MPCISKPFGWMLQMKTVSTTPFNDVHVNQLAHSLMHIVLLNKSCFLCTFGKCIHILRPLSSIFFISYLKIHTKIYGCKPSIWRPAGKRIWKLSEIIWNYACYTHTLNKCGRKKSNYAAFWKYMPWIMLEHYEYILLNTFITAVLGKIYIIYIRLYKISLGCSFQIKYVSTI